MTISAKALARDSDLLERSMDLYRDLADALRKQISGLQDAADFGGDTKGLNLEQAIRSHQKSLQSVLELEIGLAKRQDARAEGVELDLDAARAEIRARLARWIADR
jgi:hypothetical protein